MAIELDERELAELMEELLARLAADPQAAHLWRWHGRPGCDDAPPGPSRRRHLASLLGLLGAAALPAAACSSSTNAPLDGANKDARAKDGPLAADRPTPQVDGARASDGARDTRPAPDLLRPDSRAKLDVNPRREVRACADDPCACADDPCP
jgi:hypothetical protein